MSVQGYGDAHAAILGYVKSQWTETDIADPNTRYDHQGAAHVEPRINHQTAFNASFPVNHGRHPGLLTLRVRTPLDGGDGPGVDYADDLYRMFVNLNLDGIHFRRPTIRVRGRGTGADDAWFVTDVDCPFYFDIFDN